MILVGVGSNLAAPQCGSPQDTVAAALEQLPALGVAVVRRSHWYLSEPVPPSDQPWYVNGAAAVETGLDSLFVRGLRFGDRDTILLGAIPVRGRECSDVDFTLTILPGTMGELFLSLQDRAGNRACSEFHQVFALPLVDPAELARIDPWYRLVIRPWAEGQ